MKGKTLLSIVLMFIVILSYGQKKGRGTSGKGLVLTGKIATLTDSIIHLSYFQGSKNLHDSAKVVKGAFVYKTNLIEPTMATFYAANGSFSCFSFIENGNMTMTKADSASLVVVTGSKHEDYYQENKRLTDSAMNKFVNLSVQVGNLKDTALKNKRNVEEVLPAYEEYANVTKKFIVNHPYALISLYKVMELQSESNMDEIKRLFYGLDRELQTMPAAEGLVKDIKKYDQFFNKPAADFTQKNDKGESITLSSFKGKYVLVDFWASWCVPCRRENPNLVKEYEKYRSKGFEILGVSLDENEKLWKDAIAKDNLPWIHVSELNGWKNTAAVKYYITGVPSNLLVDPQGKIIAIDLRGPALGSKLEEIFN